MQNGFVCFLALLLALSNFSLATDEVAASEPSSSWPQWRGPERTGKIEGTVWPDKLDGDHLQQVWRAELGNSYSGPIVTGDRVFVTETRGAKTEHVQASIERRESRCGKLPGPVRSACRSLRRPTEIGFVARRPSVKSRSMWLEFAMSSSVLTWRPARNGGVPT